MGILGSLAVKLALGTTNSFDAPLPAGRGVQLQSASVARILTRIVPPRRCGGARKADPTRQPPGACIQASATAGSAPARHDSGPRGVADGAETAPEARPAAGWSPRALSGCRHGHLRSSVAVSSAECLVLWFCVSLLCDRHLARLASTHTALVSQSLVGLCFTFPSINQSM